MYAVFRSKRARRTILPIPSLRRAYNLSASLVMLSDPSLILPTSSLQAVSGFVYLDKATGGGLRLRH